MGQFTKYRAIAHTIPIAAINSPKTSRPNVVSPNNRAQSFGVNIIQSSPCDSLQSMYSSNCALQSWSSGSQGAKTSRASRIMVNCLSVSINCMVSPLASYWRAVFYPPLTVKQILEIFPIHIAMIFARQCELVSCRVDEGYCAPIVLNPFQCFSVFLCHESNLNT